MPIGQAGGAIYGRLPIAAVFYEERNPEMVALAKKLARYTVNGRERSLRDVAAELEAAGHTPHGNKQFSATAISRMIAS